MGTATAPVAGSGSCPTWMARVSKARASSSSSGWQSLLVNELLRVSDGGHPDERRRRVPAGGAADEGGVTVVEDAPVGGHDPVPGPGVGGGHAHDRLGQLHAAGRTVEAGRGAVGHEAED